MRKYLISLIAIAAPIAGFCQSQTTCRELDVNNTVMRLQSCGYHVISVRNMTPYADPVNATWVIVYE